LRRSGHGGVALVLLTLFLFVAMDTLVKVVIRHHAAAQIVWLRFLVHALLVSGLMLAVPRLRVRMRSHAPARQLLRSGLLLATTSCFFLALRYLKLADVAILTQASPIFIVAMAALLLRERVGPQRWLGVVAGLIGVIVIVKPGFGFQWASLLGIAAALIYAAYHIMTRSLAGADHTMTTFFYTPMVGAVLAAPFALVTWQWPGGQDLALMCLPGIVGGTGHLLLIMAFARSEASLLAPFFYITIVLAVGTGWAVFDEVPDASTFAGAGLIAAAGLYVWHRERKAAKSRGQVLAPPPQPLPLSQP
jgi:drug/metabolite transporter (DMT)-like permease